uniref:small monomeric GTPase n=1 Tax=Arcella intermedia TaxID=1963864 RepID=A0A6B2LJG6_9EUKA
MLGDGGVGKSCLTIQLTQNQFVHEYDPTIENSYRKQVEVDGNISVMDILDTAGQEEYRVLQDQYIHRGEGFVVMYSVTSRASFELVTKFQQKIFMVKDEETYFPMVIVGNKCDLDDQREVTKEEGEELAKTIGCPFFETSAKTRINVEECFVECVREIRKRREESSGGPAPAGGKKEGEKAKKPSSSSKVRGPCLIL